MFFKQSLTAVSISFLVIVLFFFITLIIAALTLTIVWCVYWYFLIVTTSIFCITDTLYLLFFGVRFKLLLELFNDKFKVNKSVSWSFLQLLPVLSLILLIKILLSFLRDKYCIWFWIFLNGHFSLVDISFKLNSLLVLNSSKINNWIEETVILHSLFPMVITAVPYLIMLDLHWIFSSPFFCLHIQISTFLDILKKMENLQN